ncbi:Centlein Centrosomal protein [Triplophysa tibetana]|uniref:Centlein Centrosomal protein n=1 Tax=Triplophysa tibetana TaxID=1572043 RepID=A0A5A9PMU6_9TELE|nr:Centlein Centrosomal protein [Triplophysa tibetana]
MDSKDNERVLFLEEEVKSLSEELAQCQADKEFVWSLWKRLQVANPDLTQAVSLVVEREKQKAENKDRKVLEILQAKDYRIQELEQKVTAEEQEINNQLQRLRGSEEECGLMKKELAALQHRLGNKSRQLKEARKQAEESEKEDRRALQEARHQLDAQRSASQAELERLRDQEAVSCARVKKLEEEVFKCRQEVLEAQSRSAALSLQLSSVEQKVTDKEQQLCKLKQELQDLQCLYKQSVEHAGEQAQLIQQLEGLNLDTQRVLRSQEEAHAADAVSYQKLYSELSMSYQALRHSKEQLCQREAALCTQLSQRDQHVQELQAQLQSFTAAVGHREEAGHKEGNPSSPQLHALEEQLSVDTRTTKDLKTQQGSTSSSQSGRSSADGTARQEQKVQRLQDLLALKIKENEDLRRAHAKHHDRLRVIQTNYRTVTKQLKEAEETHDLLRGKTQLQQDSDELWNELVLCKEENKKLLADKLKLEELLNILHVQAVLDRVTEQNLHGDKQAELLFEEVPKEEVRRSSTPIKTARRVEQTFKKIEQLQTQMVSLESEIVRLRDDNQMLREMNSGLAGQRGNMQAEIQLLQNRAVVRAAEDSQARAERNRLLTQLQNFKREAESAIKVANQARRRLLKLRQELGVLRAERDFHRSSALSKAKAFALSNNRFRSRKASSCTGAHSKQNRMDSPSKDDWEDMSADSENEEFSDSLESRYFAPTSKAPRGTKGSRYMLICPIDRPEDDLRLARSHNGNIQFQGASRQMSRRRRKQTSCVLPQRLLSLQQQVTALQADKRAAQQLATEQNLRHAQAQVQLDSLLKQLNACKQLSKKQACELAGVEQQKASLQMELEQWRQIRHQTTPNPSAVDPEHLKTQVKQLTLQLKSTSSEMSKHSAANKSLRAQLDERDQTVKELHERVSVLERDVTMKRQLLEDLRSRLKICQDSERSHRAVTEDLEKKIKSLSEDSTNRKALVDSLKRRLTVATEEKKQHMTTSQKLKEELQKKEQRLAVLQARLAECDRAMAELEQAASKQMHGLVQQSTQTLEIMQSKLTLAESQMHQLRTFIEALAHEVAREVDDTKARLKRKQKSLNEGNRVSKCSLEKAASILNMTETDLVDMLETDECEEACAGRGAETNWTERVQQILQQQIPSAGLLMDAMLVKMKEGKVLTEELAALQAAVSKNA